MALGGDRADQLSVQQLRTSCRVHELQSYTAAAGELEMSVPAVWEQVQSLQTRYRTELFVKRGRRIAPTASGDLLFRALQPVLAGLDSTFELLRDDQSAPRQPITIVAGARMMLEELAPVFQRFQREHPVLQLRVLHRDNRTAQELIANGEADLAIMLQPGPGSAHESVHIAAAYQVRYLAIAPRRHPLSRQKRITLAEIVKHPLIIGHAHTHVRQLFEQAVHREGLTGSLRISVETDNSAFTIACVRAGMGVGILAGNPLGTLSRSLATHSLQAELGEACIVCVWKQGRMLTPTIQHLVDLIGSVGK